MRLELHCHSHYSRGTKLPTEGIPSPREIIREAKRKCLGGVAITDHNVFRAAGEALAEGRRQDILVIPAIEVSSSDGHVIGLGVNDDIPRDMSVDETVELIHQQGGLAVAPHPFDIKGDGLGEAFVKADAAESFNSLNLDRFSNWVAKRKLGRFPAVAGSDAHTLTLMGNGVTVVDAQDIDGVLKAVKRGKTKQETSYARIQDVRNWSHHRFRESQDAVLKQIASYPAFRRWLSRRLLSKYMAGPGSFFTTLSYVGIACSFWYGGVKALVSL